MNIQINTDQKTIIVLNNIKLNELIKELDNLFSYNEWGEYTLLTDTPLTPYTYPFSSTAPSFYTTF